jgi:putative PEP-CTERM system histidine kinase
MMAVMILGGRETVPYSQEDLDLLETMANQFSIAVMNAQKSQELSLARELESLHRLSSMLLHDLKSSASMLSLVMQNAADNFDNPEFQKDALSTMSNAVDRIQKLISRLSAAPQKMDFQPDLQPADLVQIASGAVAKSNVRDLPRIAVVEEFNPVPQVMADLENTERVILNVILNAIEAIEGEGTITIRTYEEKIQNSASSPGSSYSVISVTDTGCGMSDKFIRESLFQPFQTTKERGLGLGLYQCKAIIDACDGVIDVQSSQGVGTNFAIKLPIKSIHEEH